MITRFLPVFICLTVYFYQSLYAAIPTGLVALNDSTSSDPFLIKEDTLVMDWERFKIYEDSLLTTLYPIPLIDSIDSKDMPLWSGTDQSEVDGLSDDDQGPPVKPPRPPRPSPSSMIVDIPIDAGFSPTGAKTYQINIDLPDGMNELTPQLSLCYNSQMGGSEFGEGWNITGVSKIMRGYRSQYFDGETRGVQNKNDDAFYLDGMRLLYTSTENGNRIYETETGNIKAKAYCDSNHVKYFEVFYPNGLKSVFGFTDSTLSHLVYPVTSTKDLFNNEITYHYTSVGENHTLNTINYNGYEVEFSYSTSTYPITKYMGGFELLLDKLVSSIRIKSESEILYRYLLSYTSHLNKSLLSEIKKSMTGFTSDPIYFNYGTSSTSEIFSSSTTQLTKWYATTDANSVRLVRGRFDYREADDCLVAFPNLNPYWKQANGKNNTIFKNIFTGKENILLYTELKGSLANSMPNIVTGEGFIEVLCADLEGNQNESIIKINNTLVNEKDRITFTVYGSSISFGLMKRYERNFDFSTVISDSGNHKSLPPKYFYAGDFTGDGKMEILAVSVNNPLENGAYKTTVWLFDLEGNKVLYQGQPFAFDKVMVGTSVSDAQTAENGSDKLIALDMDGDGKTDICKIGLMGTFIYSFVKENTNYTVNSLCSGSTINRTRLVDREFFPGDFNSDGLIDFMVSGEYGKSTNWTVYYNKGTGFFEVKTFDGPLYSDRTNQSFLTHDVNQDGFTDLVEYKSGVLTSYFNLGGVTSVKKTSVTCPVKSEVVAVEMNSPNNYTELLTVKDGILTKFSFSKNERLETLLTYLTSCLGVDEAIRYGVLNSSSWGFTKGSGAVFPFVNMAETLPVVIESQTILDETVVDTHSYQYTNPVFHKQGRGFRGFEQIRETDMRSQLSTSIYSPYEYCQLKEQSSSVSRICYTYSTVVSSNKKAQISLIKKETKDLLKGIWATSTYENDSYGLPIKETEILSDGNETVTTNTWSSKTEISDGYNIGYLTRSICLRTNENGSVQEEMNITSFDRRKPNIMVERINGLARKETSFTYDRYGNILKKNEKPYSASKSFQTTYEYDTYGRIVKTTDAFGLSESYTYNSIGQKASLVDVRGGTTKYSYDKTGKLLSISYPDGTTEYHTVARSDDNEPGLYVIMDSHTGEPITKTYYDALNREIRIATQRFDDRYLIVDIEYDKYGDKKRETLPYFDGGAKLWITNTYDVYGRIIKTVYPSGKTETQSYSGNTVTSTDKGVKVTRSYDCHGDLVKVADNQSDIVYNLAPDGLPVSINTDDMEVIFSYDTYRRKRTMTDPSHGTVTWEYDAMGNVSREINGNGKSSVHSYDSYGRLIKTVNDEFTVTHTYDLYSNRTSSISTNGCRELLTWDNFGRLSKSEYTGAYRGVYKKTYTYNAGNLVTCKFSGEDDTQYTENYTYTNGTLTTIDVEGIKIYELKEENSHGQASKIISGGIEKVYTYTDEGLPLTEKYSKGSVIYANRSYQWDSNTQNLLSRTDVKRNLRETFGYDDLNRLTSYGDKSISYAENGNILQKADVGTYSYSSGVPFAVSAILRSSDSKYSRLDQNLTFTSFDRVNLIEQDGVNAYFDYDWNKQRVTMDVAYPDSYCTVSYLGDSYECKEVDYSGEILERFYVGGDYYTAPAVFVKAGSRRQMNIILRDYLGSIIAVVNSSGTMIQELSYDPWGNLRDPETQLLYESGSEPELYLGRGFTGHEHLAWCGVINMNARLYDPMMGRFISPDPQVQIPDCLQNFNRYTYCMNNPLCYVDEDGEFFWFVIGAAALIGGVVNVATHWKDIKAAGGGWNSFWKGASYFGVGALAGGAGAAAGMALMPVLAPTIGSITSITATQFSVASMGIVPGATFGAANGMANGFLLDAGNSLIQGKSFGQAMNAGAKGALQGAVSGGIAGGVSGGIAAHAAGENLAKGCLDKVPKSVTYHGYFGYDPDTGVEKYVGITRRDPLERFQEHLNSGTVRSTLRYEEINRVFDSKIEARIWEQSQIMKFGMVKNKGQLFNLRNEIAPKYWKKYGLKK